MNRNFPIDWNEDEEFETKSKCSYNYASLYPLSELETQAITKIVETYNITHSMSFYSRASNYRLPLLIYPYTSTRSFRIMDKKDVKRFQR